MPRPPLAVLLVLGCPIGSALAQPPPSALTIAAGQYATQLVQCDNSEWENVVRQVAGILYDRIGQENALAAVKDILSQVTSAKGPCDRERLTETRTVYQRTLAALR